MDIKTRLYTDKNTQEDFEEFKHKFVFGCTRVTYTFDPEMNYYIGKLQEDLANMFGEERYLLEWVCGKLDNLTNGGWLTLYTNSDELMSMVVLRFGAVRRP
jgi:hypothetical protein